MNEKTNSNTGVNFCGEKKKQNEENSPQQFQISTFGGKVPDITAQPHLWRRLEVTMMTTVHIVFNLRPLILALTKTVATIVQGLTSEPATCSIVIFVDLQPFDCNLKGRLFDPSLGLRGRCNSGIGPFDSQHMGSY